MENHYLKKELDALIKKDDKIFDFLQNACLDGLWYWDLESPEHEWLSDRFWQVLGYDPSEKKHLASEWQDIINQDDLQLAVENFNKHCENAFHPYDQLVRYRHKKGHTVWIRCRGMAIRDENGAPIRMLGAHTDMTPLKTVEKENTQLIDRIDQEEALKKDVTSEIQFPIKFIASHLEVIKERHYDEFDTEAKLAIKQMIDAVWHLQSLSNKLKRNPDEPNEQETVSVTQ